MNMVIGMDIDMDMDVNMDIDIDMDMNMEIDTGMDMDLGMEFTKFCWGSQDDWTMIKRALSVTKLNSFSRKNITSYEQGKTESFSFLVYRAS